MSRLIDEAAIACRRWRDHHPESPPPVVRVVLISGEAWYFNGIAVAPSLEAPQVAVMSSAGLGGNTLVVRDHDVYLVEIEPLGAQAA